MTAVAPHASELRIPPWSDNGNRDPLAVIGPEESQVTIRAGWTRTGIIWEIGGHAAEILWKVDPIGDLQSFFRFRASRNEEPAAWIHRRSRSGYLQDSRWNTPSLQVEMEDHRTRLSLDATDFPPAICQPGARWRGNFAIRLASHDCPHYLFPGDGVSTPHAPRNFGTFLLLS